MAKRAKPNVARRQSYDQIIEVLSPIHFCRMFRMHRCSFDRLCECVNSKVGESTLKLQEWLLSHDATKPSTCHATNALGGILSGEVKIAIMLRVMAGASYLDVLLAYGVSTATVYSVFHKAAAWMPSTFQFPFIKWITLKDEAALNSVAEGFSSASGWIFRKCIGALDGVAI